MLVFPDCRDRLRTRAGNAVKASPYVGSVEARDVAHSPH